MTNDISENKTAYNVPEEILALRASRLDLALEQLSAKYGNFRGWNKWDYPNYSIYKFKYSEGRSFEFRVRDSARSPEQRINNDWSQIETKTETPHSRLGPRPIVSV